MKVLHMKRRKLRLCQEKYGLVVLVSLAVIFLLGAYPGQAPAVRAPQETSFNIQDSGVIVLIHMANTGTDLLSNYLIRQAVLDPPCRCPNTRTKCRCLNRQGHPWLFNAFNTTGYVCGQEADLSAIRDCPIDYWFRTSGRDTRPLRRYLLVTIIREPTERLISQWQSLTQENTFFKNEPRMFRNQSIELQKAGLACYMGKKLSDLSLQDFLNCSENGASNYQTRKLANMSFINSLGLTGARYQEAMLASARSNLEMLPFFGLYDRPRDTQKLLESTLGFRFKQHFSLEDSVSQHGLPLPVSLHRQVLQANTLDLRLFQFAKEIFQERVKSLKSTSVSGSKILVDNFRVIHRPDLNIKGEDVAMYPTDLNLEIGSQQGSDDILEDYDVIEIEDSPIKQEEDNDEDNQTDGSSQRLPSQIASSIEYDHYREYYDDKMRDGGKKILKNGAQPNMEMVRESHKFVPEITNWSDNSRKEIYKRSDNSKPDMYKSRPTADIRSNMDGKSPNSKLGVDPMSPDYTPDVEDVFVFMNRLTKLKQQQKEQPETQQQQQLQQPKPLPQLAQQQGLEQINSLSSYSSAKSSLMGFKHGLLHSDRSAGRLKTGTTMVNRLHRSTTGGRVKPTKHTLKTDRKLKDKGINRMFS